VACDRSKKEGFVRSLDYAATPTVLYSFCALANCADGEGPRAGLIADSAGNLFGTTEFGGVGCRPVPECGGTVFEIAKTATGYAAAPTILVSFCSLANCADGRLPAAGLIADSAGNLFGTTDDGGNKVDFFCCGGGTVFEITKTATGYAATPTVLYPSARWRTAPTVGFRQPA
jgi:hypothetical protein